MKSPDTRTAMALAKGLLSLGFALAAGFYGYSLLEKDAPPTNETPESPAVVTPTTAADECAVQVIEQSILPSLENIAADFRVAVQSGLLVDTAQPVARITAAANYKMKRCEQTTGAALTDEFVAEQMQRVENTSTAFIEEFKPKN